MTRLVPFQDSTHRCATIPKKICAIERKSPITVKVPRWKKWCEDKEEGLEDQGFQEQESDQQGSEELGLVEQASDEQVNEGDGSDKQGLEETDAENPEHGIIT